MGPALRRLGAACLVVLLAACAGLVPPPPPKLVVVIVVDGLPQRQVLAYRDQLASDGLARFLGQGRWFAEAHMAHAYTVTASGHATLATGAWARRHGIIGNSWRDLETGASISAGADPDARFIGERQQPDDDTSPRRLLAETVGDVLRRQQPAAKVIAVAGKARAAVLPAGRSGTAYMFMADSGRFASSTYYMQAHPAWVDAFNAAKPADRWFRAEWTPLLPEAAYARSAGDDQPWFGRGGGRLPMRMAGPDDGAPGRAYYEALLSSPFADALTLEFAQAALDGERLGRDDAPDLLFVSLSGHDYVNHQWSAESRLSHDHVLQLDRLLQEFLRALDARVGREHYLAVLTSDHGFMPSPDWLGTQGHQGGRLATSQVLAQVDEALERRFGVARLVAFSSASALVLDRTLLAAHRLDGDAVAQAARASLAAMAGIAAAYTRRELDTGSRAGAPWFREVQRSWHRERSGDVQYMLQPHWMLGQATATHGSPHGYDTHVPLLLWGPRWVQPGRVAARVEAVDLAPTLARLLGIAAPAASAGRPLPLR